MDGSKRAPFLAWRSAVATVLVATALLKVHRLATGVAASARPDPITSIDMVPLMTGVAMLEVAVAAALFVASFRGAAYFLLVVAAGFVSHGLLRAFYGISECPCLSTDLPWHWLNWNQTRIAQTIAWWLLFSALWWLTMARHQPAATDAVPTRGRLRSNSRFL